MNFGEVSPHLLCAVKKKHGKFNQIDLKFSLFDYPHTTPHNKDFCDLWKKNSLSRFRIYKRISTPHPCKNYASCHMSILFLFLMRTVPNVTDIMEYHFNINTIRSRIFCNYLYIYLDLSSLLYISMKIQQFLQ